MKFLNIIASADPRSGGPIEGVLQISAVLRRWGHQHELLTLDPPDAPFLLGYPVPVHAFGRSGPRRGHERLSEISPAALRWARAHVRDFDVVIVNGLWNFSTVVARWALVGSDTPYVVYTHGMLDPWFKRRYPLKYAAKQALWLLNEGPLLRHAAAVAFTCEEERRLARTTFRPYKVRERVVRYGAADVPPPCSGQRAAFLATVPSLGERPYLLFLSRIHEKKGCDLLVDAFAKVAAAHPQIDLVIAGPDQTGLRSQLETQAKDAGIAARIHWPGMLAGNAKWGAFHGCEAFVLPSHQENFGIVVAEAMACAKPVLISNQVNIWREIEEAQAGLVAPDTAAGTLSLLHDFLALPAVERLAMSERARTGFVERFEIHGAATDLLEVLSAAVEAEPAK